MKEQQQECNIARRKRLMVEQCDRKKIVNVMQIAWNEWLFNYFSLVIYYRLGNLFLHLRANLFFSIRTCEIYYFSLCLEVTSAASGIE